jgi:Metal-dependent hydrolases of the beta-lactamase superfamily I
MIVNFISLSSGSNGNCYYIGTKNYGFLIDAGIGVRTIKKRLSNAGLSIDNVRAVFITHDHIDHVVSAGILSEKSFLPVYATEKIHEGMNRNPMVLQKIYTGKRIIEKSSPLMFDDFSVEAFDVPHDSSDSVGYTFVFDNKRFTLATDLGCVCESAKKQISMANYLVIEANYDEQMLDTGRYPFTLKNRIRANTGHLSNAQTAECLSENFNEKLSHIWLCHLSKENNTSELAYKTVAAKLAQSKIYVGKDVNLYALPRTSPTDVFVL